MSPLKKLFLSNTNPGLIIAILRYVTFSYVQNHFQLKETQNNWFPAVEKTPKKPKINKTGYDWGRLTRINNDKLENIGQFFQDVPFVINEKESWGELKGDS